MKLTLKKRIKGLGHATAAPMHGRRVFTFDDVRHRAGDISGEVYVKETLLAELGDPVSVEIIFNEE